MKSTKNLGAFIFHIRSTEAIGFTSLATETYFGLFSHLDPRMVDKLVFQKPRELTLSTDVMPIEKAFAGILLRERKLKCHIVLVEMLDRNADMVVYDDICEALLLALREKGTVRPWCIGIAAAHQDVFRRSVLLNERLVPHCKKVGIGLILLSDNQNVKPIVLCQGKLPLRGDLPQLQPQKVDTRRQPVVRLTPDQIAGNFQVLFGHFEVEQNGSAFHVPAVASTKKLARNALFLQQLENDVLLKLGSASFSIYPLGISGGGMNELSSALVQGDANRLLDETKMEKHDGSPVLILCDFLAPVYPFKEIVRQAKNKGTHQIAIVGIAGYNNKHDIEGIESFAYLQTSHEAIPSEKLSECRFCQQNIAPIKGDHFDVFARKIKEFDALTFWEFIGQTSDFFAVGHWKSDITPNHYLFRVHGNPIFKTYAYDISVRLRNIFDTKSIRPWIKKIVCTEDEASAILSKELCEVLGLQQEDLIQIPRKYFSSIAGTQLDPDLQKYIDSKYDINSLKRQNVIIVDQAAHHFKTMSSLRYICDFFECTVLAFAVFVDRTDKAFSLGDYLHDSHYIALYSWPVPPRRAHECQCKEGH